MLYEELQDNGFGKFESGIISGVIATALTHPFELIRAKIQTFGIKSKYVIGDRHLNK